MYILLINEMGDSGLSECSNLMIFYHKDIVEMKVSLMIINQLTLYSFQSNNVTWMGISLSFSGNDRLELF